VVDGIVQNLNQFLAARIQPTTAPKPVERDNTQDETQIDAEQMQKLDLKSQHYSELYSCPTLATGRRYRTTFPQKFVSRQGQKGIRCICRKLFPHFQLVYCIYD
jgi:hypothetical protein